MGSGRVDFPAYCRAFEIMNEGGDGEASQICGSLDPSEEVYAVAYLERGAVGDGVVRVPEYRIESGRSRVVGYCLLTQDGKIIRQTGSEREEIAEVSPETAQYFIAGAFGTGELRGGGGLDRGIVRGLQATYVSCLNDSESCLESRPAKTVASRLKTLGDEQQRLEDAKAKVAELRAEYDKLSKEIGRQSDFLSKTAIFSDAISRTPNNKADYDLLIVNLGKVLAIARAVRKEEAAQEASEKRRRDAADRYAMIPVLEQRAKDLRREIAKAEGSWHYRFTNAYDAAMACMPTGGNMEERSCVAHNKELMARELLGKAKNFPEREICLEWEGGWTNGLCKSDRQGLLCSNYEEHYICRSSKTEGQDYTENELMQSAKYYCTTECK